MAAASTDVLDWNAGPAGAVAGALGFWDAVVTGAGPGAVVVAVGSGRAGVADVLAGVLAGVGRGAVEAGGWVPPHPAASRLSAVAATAAVTAALGRRGSGPDAV